jgi:serralysin
MAILPTSGVAANGKPIFDWDDAAAQLTRSGNSWSPFLGAATSVTYGFRATASGMPSGVGGFQQFNAAQILATEEALRLWADVANITFTRVGFGSSGASAYTNNATILFANYTTETDSASAFAFLPTPNARGSLSPEGDVWVDVSESQNAAPVYGDFGPHVFAHEIGHAIGLNHPGNYDGGSPTYSANASYWQDARMFTIMSYFGSTNTGGNLPAFSWGPQLHDIAAAQRLYGPNMTTRTGDTTYGFNSTAGRTLFDISSASDWALFSIWDAGGVDTLDLSGYSENADIDLRAESFSSAGPTPDAGPAVYNISIARGVVIENAIGGSGADLLTGNNAGNHLSGGAGIDTLLGGAGDDTLHGGAGADAVDGGAGIDAVDYTGVAAKLVIRIWNQTVSGDGADGDVIVNIEGAIGGAVGDAIVGSETVGNFLAGGGGDDAINGLSGYDTLRGGQGADRLDGGTGLDTLDYSDATGKVVVRLWNQTASGDIAEGDLISGFERVFGGAGGDAIVGSENIANYLVGNGGADFLQGLSGDDYLVGGAGADTLSGGAGNDKFEFTGASGADRITDFAGGAGSGDVIRLVGYGPALDSFAEVIAATAQSGANAVITLGPGAVVTLLGVDKASLAADDFLFG